MDLPRFSLRLHVPERTEPTRWMIGPRSLFADRVIPDLEFIALPPRHFAEASGVIEADPKNRPTADYRGRADRLLPWRQNQDAPEIPEDSYAVDLRPRGLANWSHALNQAVPIALKIRDELRDRGGRDPFVILSPQGFGKVREFFEHLGFVCVVTDDTLDLPQVTYTEDQRTVVRHFARSWVTPHLDDVGGWTDEIALDCGDLLFFSRKGDRSIANNDEVEALLKAKGFTTVFPEDYSLLEQLAMVKRARKIVAIHGAGLAPLMYRQPQDGPFIFVEIFSAGHVTDFFRKMAEPLPCNYRAVRGIPDPAMLPAAYEPTTRRSAFAKAHSLKAFKIDPLSLEAALGPDPVGELLAGERPAGLPNF